MKKNWYRITAKADRPPDIVLYDEIGSCGITAKDFLNDLQSLGDVEAITLRLNSPGGSVFDGIAIHNALKRHQAKVTVFIDGIAASIASVIAMAGDEVIMPENAMLMIHDPSGLVWGTATDMRAMAEALDRMKSGLVAAYRDKSGIEDAEIDDLMARETWLTAQEAVALGFADRMEKPVKMAASFDLTRFKNTPAGLTCHSHEQGAEPETANVVNLEAVRQDERKKTMAYVTEVQDLCALAGAASQAAGFIAKAMPVKEIRASLLKARARQDEETMIHHQHGPALVRAEQPIIDTQAIYAARNQPNR
ncbi:MAG: Clp protease ClpP [Magnetococcales bacterium]|nr:Clp protease ClpP [Magnetococcales bacterium]